MRDEPTRPGAGKHAAQHESNLIGQKRTKGLLAPLVGPLEWLLREVLQPLFATDCREVDGAVPFDKYLSVFESHKYMPLTRSVEPLDLACVGETDAGQFLVRRSDKHLVGPTRGPRVAMTPVPYRGIACVEYGLIAQGVLDHRHRQALRRLQARLSRLTRGCQPVVCDGVLAPLPPTLCWPWLCKLFATWASARLSSGPSVTPRSSSDTPRTPTRDVYCLLANPLYHAGR